MTEPGSFTPEQRTNRIAGTIVEMIRNLRTPLPETWANKILLEIEKNITIYKEEVSNVQTGQE